mgnify:CR=1 FL=1
MGLFVTFEGPDGSGKTTQIALLAEYLRGLGYTVLITREPGGTSIGDQIRVVLHDVANANMTAPAEFLLYSASRAQLVRQVIRPHLDKGEIVISDRYADSSTAYQGYGRGLPLDVIQMITQFATDGLKPDLTIYLDLPAEVGIQRKQTAHAAQGGEWNRLDSQTLEFHCRVRDGYLCMARAEPQRWMVVDALQAIEAIQHTIRQRVTSLLPELGKVEIR